MKSLNSVFHLNHELETGVRYAPPVDCAADPIRSLCEMFVGIVQGGRIAKGQCPALRPVFLKHHGVARGRFQVNRGLPEDLRVGLFAGSEFPAWVRFSSDTLTSISDFKTTLGVGIKLFGVPGNKLVGNPSDKTFDILVQNFDVFFVDNAREMCEFTRAGVVEHNYDLYLDKHPETAKLLDDMAKPVTSVLASAYWSGVPFAFGLDRFVKYKLEPTLELPPPMTAPSDPTYLAGDLASRLSAGEARFRFLVQFRTDPACMPLDKAMTRWDSPFIHLADLVLPRQNIRARGQADYGENLAYNIWRVTAPHTPQGSIANARRTVYEASANQRRDINGIPVGEPDEPRPMSRDLPCRDTTVVRAAIHPAIGIARVGDSEKDFYVGPEVVDPTPPKEGYRDTTGALKRQVARYHVYGYNASGEVVRELTSNDASIRWTVRLANKKAAWYQFQAALDITDAASMTVPLRNPDVEGDKRRFLTIDPGPRSISGAGVSGPEYRFDSGMFYETVVPLGEIQTDADGCLLVFGGHGVSASPTDAPIYRPTDRNSFNNANGWYDDISDGPVTASVSIEGVSVPVEPAWVSVAPPNYAPQIIGWRTLYDLLVDVYTANGWMAMPGTVSFSEHVAPLLRRLSNLQWVNQGFASLFGQGCPLDFENPDLLAKLAQTPDLQTNADPYAELRQVIFNGFRPSSTVTNESSVHDTNSWPWIYGDAYGSFSPTSSNNNLPLPSVQAVLLKRWVEGDFVNDWKVDRKAPHSLADVPLAEQPAMLDKAALHFCLADAFHPGCEMTWPMRHTTMYSKPFRIRHREEGVPEPDYGTSLSQATVLNPGGPLYAQGPGDISRWMALPWQGDTAFCRSGYDPEYDPYVPTFWPARVPNQVLTEEDYETVVDSRLPREQRLVAYNHRAHWTRTLKGSVAESMMRMVKYFGAMGIVEARPGVKDDPDFPEIMYVESLTGSRLKEVALMAAALSRAPERPLTRLERAGWDSQEQLEEFRSVRVRFNQGAGK